VGEELKTAAEYLQKRDNFHIICHVNPDGDAVGSAAGLALILHGLGKKTKVRCAGEFPHVFDFLSLRLPQDCETPETVVSVDTASVGQWGKLWADYNRCDLSFDHHISHAQERFEDILVLDPKAAATGVIILQLAKELGAELTPDIADALFTAVSTDTGCFKYANTDVGAHAAAIELTEAGADTETITRKMFETRSRSEMEMWRMILDSIKYYSDGKIAVVTVTQKMREKAGFYNDDLGEMASIPRQIEGVECGITLKQLQRAVYKISVRTNEKLSAEEICKAFGGGGHTRAAGCTIRGSQIEVRDKLIAKAEEQLAAWTD